ncbi:VOC family protein [Modestobacter sp. VKM Ac-2977]|uniref:VOC family protein n=1 Tax=Modestobacter sp. VKM Ac-2977 TaxID=3004131 RepID=UPI0022AA5E0E|nr:VOC family protein [Modestobacter sp. VKM Ac-2977]MCZ2822117.1 VOC family protein [Modestobacter sp. VKM Ac-2977]
MSVPQRLSFVTIGVRDAARSRAFYAGWGWQERPGGSDDFAQFDVGTTRLALFPLDRLASEAAPDADLPAPGTWNGITLAVNVAARGDVDQVHAAAAMAGARVVTAPVDREWGGRSGYVADPDGTRWEVAWLPGLLPG